LVSSSKLLPEVVKVGKSTGTASHSFKGKHGCRGVGYRLPLG
jgi:hypothetical protein